MKTVLTLSRQRRNQTGKAKLFWDAEKAEKSDKGGKTFNPNCRDLKSDLIGLFRFFCVPLV
jgi:hypothetical protein